MYIIPWLFSIATGIWFGMAAARAERSWLLWAGGGALFALIVSTILLGLGHAALIPVRTNAYSHMILRSVAASAVLIGIPGWLILRSLRRENK